MKKLGLIGGGNMAEALVRGLLAKRIFAPADLIVADPDSRRRRLFSRTLKVEATAGNRLVLRQARAIVLAIKPQAIEPVLEEIAASMGDRAAVRAGAHAKAGAQNNRLFISIAAGVRIGRIEARLGGRPRVVRVMPNAPAMVGCGMAGIAGGSYARRADLLFTLRLFKAVGEAVALKDETQIDVVTALSGSGPAYVYLFAQSLADAAVVEGLESATAIAMAVQTLRGAAEMLGRSRQSTRELIRMVASPGGTTEAALKRFAEDRFSDIVANAVHAAAVRSRELARKS